MVRTYYVLLFYRGYGQWTAEVIDFDRVIGYGASFTEALRFAEKALQVAVDGILDHRELPWPTHRLVAESLLVKRQAHGIDLVAVNTKLESDIPGADGPLDAENEEKSNDSKHQGGKKVGRHGGYAKRGGRSHPG